MTTNKKNNSNYINNASQTASNTHKIDEVNDKQKRKMEKNGHSSKYHSVCSRLFYVYINKSHLSKQAPLPIMLHSAFFFRTFIFSRYHTHPTTPPSPTISRSLSPFSYIYIPFHSILLFSLHFFRRSVSHNQQILVPVCHLNNAIYDE